MMNVNNRIPNKQVAFTGKGSAILEEGGKILKSIDFTSQNAPRNAVMVLYTGCILSRIANSRDKYEFKETVLRDSFGWASLFFAATLAEKVVGYIAEKMAGRIGNKNGFGLFIGKNTDKLPKNLWEVIKRKSEFSIRSFEDIKAIEKKAPDVAKSIMNVKCLSYLGSLGVAIAILGIGIPTLNVITTRYQIKHKKSGKTNGNGIDNSIKETQPNIKQQTMEDLFMSASKKASDN